MEKYEKPSMEVVDLQLEESILSYSTRTFGMNYDDDVDNVYR